MEATSEMTAQPAQRGAMKDQQLLCMVCIYGVYGSCVWTYTPDHRAENVCSVPKFSAGYLVYLPSGTVVHWYGVSPPRPRDRPRYL